MRGRAIIGLSILAVVVFLLYELREVMLPFEAGLALAYLLDPLADRLERTDAASLRTSRVRVPDAQKTAIITRAVLRERRPRRRRSRT